MEGIVLELDKAQKSIRVQTYSFASHLIAKGLVAAQERGLKVDIFLDKSHLTE